MLAVKADSRLENENNMTAVNSSGRNAGVGAVFSTFAGGSAKCASSKQHRLPHFVFLLSLVSNINIAAFAELFTSLDLM
jgi:hypothetical protein